MRKLTKKQLKFVAEYRADYNGTQAAIRAGYSRKTANEQAARLLAKVSIQEAIAAANVKTLNKLEVTAERVLQELARISFFDIRKLYRDNGSMLLPCDWDDDTAAAVAGLEVLEEFAGYGDERELIGHTKKVKTIDKKGSLELLGKHLKLFTEKIEHSGQIAGATVAMTAEQYEQSLERLRRDV